MASYDKYNGTVDAQDKDSFNDLFLQSDFPQLEDAETELQVPMLAVDLDAVNSEASKQARLITERLSNYFFDEKYIHEHPYIPAKIANEMDNIRRLLKMLAINEKAQDTLIMSITSNLGKGTLYSALTSLQNSMLNIQTQLNNLTSSLENIFKDMQDNCEKTFAEKDKENDENGGMIVRGSREFINNINNYINGDKTLEEDASIAEVTINDVD